MDIAIRYMIDHLASEYNITREQAYCLLVRLAGVSLTPIRRMGILCSHRHTASIAADIIRSDRPAAIHTYRSVCPHRVIAILRYRLTIARRRNPELGGLIIAR